MIRKRILNLIDTSGVNNLALTYREQVYEKNKEELIWLEKELKNISFKGKVDRDMLIDRLKGSINGR